MHIYAGYSEYIHISHETYYVSCTRYLLYIIHTDNSLMIYSRIKEWTKVTVEHRVVRIHERATLRWRSEDSPLRWIS